MTMETVHDVFKNELFDIYNAEKQLLKALPKMAEKASHQELADAFNTHLEETRNQIDRLEEVIDMLDLETEREKCEAMEGLITEGKELMKKIPVGNVLDAALITAAQKIEHYEIASYGCLCAFAKGLGYDGAAEILHETLEEEKATDVKLTDMAERTINQDALKRAA